MFWYYLFVPLALAALQFLLSNWIRIRLQESIVHEYQKRLVDYEKEISKREKSSQIARLLAVWISGEKGFTDKDKSLKREKLTKLSYEMALWVPDEKLIIEIGKTLRKSPETREVEALILACRELIQGKKNVEITMDDITAFPQEQ